jgi:hypothetical protein
MCKVFTDGLNREDVQESVHMRQHAYMLLLGITLDEMKNKIVPQYEVYKNQALKRYQMHFNQKGHLNKESS